MEYTLFEDGSFLRHDVSTKTYTHINSNGDLKYNQSLVGSDATENLNSWVFKPFRLDKSNKFNSSGHDQIYRARCMQNNVDFAESYNGCTKTIVDSLDYKKIIHTHKDEKIEFLKNNSSENFEIKCNLK